jgi:hypothetical protein
MTSTIPTPNLDAENERHAAASQAAAQRDFALAMQGNALLANATPAPVGAPAPAGTATTPAPATPAAASAAPRTYEAPNDAPDWLAAYDRTAVQPLYNTTKDHERRISKLETSGVGGVPGSAWRTGGIVALITLFILMFIFTMLVGANFTPALFWSVFVAFVVGGIVTAIAAGRNHNQHN